MNPRKMTSSFSNREKMRRNPFSRGNNRSTSLRRLYISRSYSTGADRGSVYEFVRRALVRLDYAGRIRASRTRGWSGATWRR